MALFCGYTSFQIDITISTFRSLFPLQAYVHTLQMQISFVIISCQSEGEALKATTALLVVSSVVNLSRWYDIRLIGIIMGLGSCGNCARKKKCGSNTRA